IISYLKGSLITKWSFCYRIMYRVLESHIGDGNLIELQSLVHLPSRITRGPNTSFELPVEANVLDAHSSATYLDFTTKLENMHNIVQMWVGGTMTRMMYSPQDPIFWHYHANVDRIWVI
ncbi:MAG TPA: tyrosinase family protein, partial [Nitrososphaeraceae archaeon]|nr:tyrosinase family protein [Nitrososphaeraceae archaeon]